MGIHGIYKEIGPGRRVALSKLAAEHYVAHSRPFRLAIDISIWLFQIQSGKGGSNPALRTFYYRLLRLLSLNIHPLFVFDGPNKPTFKRNKKVGGPNVRVSSVPEFLAKQLLKHFGFPLHYAPGEAEAECALLQREGLVDAVLSEDVDTLMFGSGMTLRSWTAEQKSSKTPTHVNVYEAQKTKETSGLDREGMILIAMMSGGDYIPEGIPGCGPKLACEAARAGFGADLCNLDKKDTQAISEWRDRLRHEIRTNESKFFRQKRPGLTIPDTFPNPEVLGYYTHPCVSGRDKITKLRDSLKWDMPLDYPSLRDFTADAFDWRCIGGAKKFVRNLAPAILVRELRMRGEARDDHSNDLFAQEAAETSLINAIHGKREHPTTDKTLELRISFTPIQLVNIDLSIEEPDEEIPADEEDSDSEPPLATESFADEEGECPTSPKKKRAPSTYDPTIHEKIWLLDTFVRLGAPLKVQDWEAGVKPARAKPARTRKPSSDKGAGGMQRGALDRFTKVMKPGVTRQAQEKTNLEADELDLSGINALAKERSAGTSAKEPARSSRPKFRSPVPEMDLSGMPTIAEVDLSGENKNGRKRSSKRPSPEPLSPRRVARPRMMSPPRKASAPHEVIELLSSPAKPMPQRNIVAPPLLADIRDHFKRFSKGTDRSPQHNLDIPLPDTVTRRRRRSPLKKYQTAPVAGKDDMESPNLRPLTPKGFDIEAIDLASPDSLPSLPRFRGSLNQPYTQSGQTAQATSIPEVQSPSARAYKCRSVSPHVIADAAQGRKEMEIINLLSSMPTPPHEEGEEDVFAKPTVSASALLPANKQLRDRKTEANTSKKMVTSTVSALAAVTGNPIQSGSSEIVQTASLASDESISLMQGKRVKKRFIQPRESLPGGWKEIELEVDLTAPSPKDRRRYRKSGVEELDLTGG